MSFGSSGFGGFGTNNNQQQSSGFGGFGSTTNNNNTSGFGSSGFGAPSTNNPGGSIFGGGAGTTTTNSGFGSGGFGSTSNSSPFGAAKPAFGQPAANSGGSIFGSSNNNASSGFGGFGSAANNTTTNTGFGASTGFGSNNTTSGFGSTNTTGGSLFGGGGTTTNTGFGSTGTTSTFGQPANTGFGSTNNNNANTQNNGTGSVQFNEQVEKEAGSTNKYQSISCLPAYTNWSFEELRTVDYAQGRKQGNSNGQAGAFGTSTGFGGFGQTNNTASTGFGSANTGSTFGQPANTASTGGFGSNTGSAFGSNTGGGMFGAKPAGGGIFGSTNTATTNTGGGIFGNAANNTASTGFGSTNNTTTGFGSTANNGAGLFGQPQKQPGTFGTATSGGFGSTSGFGSTTNNTTTSAFGQPNNTAGTSSIFGASTTNNNNTSSPFGGFGQNNQAQQPQTQSSGFGSFGQQNNDQNKSVFGQTTGNTGTGIFGQQQQQQQPSSLFGGAQQNNQSGGLFGGAKPATTGGMFGNSTNNTGGTSLFGGAQPQQNQTSNPFGQTNQAKPNAFGSTTNGNSMFGGFGNNQQQQQQQPGNSLFGNTQNQQSSFGGGNSLFGGSMQGGQQQQSQQLSTSIMSNNPYGNEHLFANLGTPQQAVGPLATPLSSSQRARKPAPLPTYKLNPSASSRLITPQKRSGYGFEYSNYGTPGSAYSNASSPYGGSLLSSSRLGSTLTRSLSAGALGRSSLSPSESVLNPNAFSSGGMKAGGAGSLKKLRINRNLRTDLFGSADSAPEASRTSPLKKTVTFGGEEHQEDDGRTNGESSNALVRVEDSEDSSMPSAEEQGYMRSSATRPSARTNGSSSGPEMQQVKGKELAVVPEHGSPPQDAPAKSSSKGKVSISQEDQEPGDYYMKPSLEELNKMTRKELGKVKPFIVGREGCGYIEFHQVDLNDVNLDDIIGEIVNITTRSATVYLDHANKPPNGKDLNVPATVTLGNSWARTRGGRQPLLETSGPRYEKHLERLRRVQDTEFIEYRAETGEWVFGVEHFSTYALDYSDDNDSILSTPLHTPMDEGANPQTSAEDTSMVSNDDSVQDSNVDDTFEFRSSRALPGAFDDDAQMYEDMAGNGEQNEERNDVSDDEEEMVQGHGIGARRDSSVFNDTAPLDEQDAESFHKHSPNFAASLQPKSILKASAYGGTPSRKPVIGADWASQLQRTLSPKKQDRQALRESQGIFATAPFTQSTRMRPQVNFAASTKTTNDNKPIATSIDLMNSLFGQSIAKAAPVVQQSTKPDGFQWPYAKRSNPDEADLSNEDKAFHHSFKPSWTSNGMLVFSSAKDAKDDALVTTRPPVHSDTKDVQFAQLYSSTDSISIMLEKQLDISEISLDDGVPYAQLSPEVDFAELAQAVQGDSPTAQQEKIIWELASILFDKVDHHGEAFSEQEERKANLVAFWERITTSAAEKHIESTSVAEEKAIAQLSTHDVWGASETLTTGKDFRLATMIAQLDGDNDMEAGMVEQIKKWREADVVPEMTLAIRTLYELLAGNTCVSNGKGGSVGLENRAETFNISSRFGLDWKRAFGLKLWYGISSDEPLDAAVQAFSADLESGDEKVQPAPWFVEQKVETGWTGEKRGQCQDVLWGLLRLYASRTDSSTSSTFNLGEILTPENVAGNPVDARLSFQLFQLLHATSSSSDEDEDTATHTSDILTSTLISQLYPTPTHLTSAILAALYLSSPAARVSTIRALLNRHASVLSASNAEPSPISATLVNDLKIPESWLWSARALYAAAVQGDHAEEIRCLLRASEFEEAHDRLRTTVAPRMLIEEDLDDLEALLQECRDAGLADVSGWESGGRLYTDYVRLVSLYQAGVRIGQQENEGGTEVEELEDVVMRLLQATQAAGERARKMGLEERVAVSEMRGLVERVRRESGEELEEGGYGSEAVSEEFKRAGEASERFYERFAGSVAVGA